MRSAELVERVYESRGMKGMEGLVGTAQFIGLLLY